MTSCNIVAWGDRAFMQTEAAMHTGGMQDLLIRFCCFVGVLLRHAVFNIPCKSGALNDSSSFIFSKLKSIRSSFLILRSMLGFYER